MIYVVQILPQVTSKHTSSSEISYIYVATISSLDELNYRLHPRINDEIQWAKLSVQFIERRLFL